MRKAAIACSVCCSLAGLPHAADAQGTPAGGPPRVHPGQTVWVTTSDGAERSGKVVSVSPSTLEMTATNGSLSMPVSDIRRIEIRDGLKNGARNGALIGGVSLGTYLGVLSRSLRCERDCGANYSATRDTVGAVAFGIGAGAGAGALAGLFVDHLVKGRQVAYAGAARRSMSWWISPILAESRLRVYVTVHWK